MSTRHVVIPILAAMLLVPAGAQTPADLFQKGLHAQETAGDLDGAIRIFRQVAAEPRNKPLAAQAQYQLVLCMLQKGDRAGASKELDALARNFPEQPDLLAKARKLIPGSAALLPAPWGEGETSQLNLKRGGAFTGETLYYSVDQFSPDLARQANSQHQGFRWELTTAKTKRSVFFNADRTTMQALGEPRVEIDDALGDADAATLGGPAIDLQQSVFLIRRLPLAPGFKNTLTSWPLIVGQTAAKQLELTVLGIEPVQVTAGRFNCFKVVFSALGQTFWIGVDGTRPLVKIQAGGVEAELVKRWGPENILESALAPIAALGWTVGSVNRYPARSSEVSITRKMPSGVSDWSAYVTVTKVYTPSAQIEQALRERVKASVERSNYVVRAGSIQPRVIGGRQALSWWVDYALGNSESPSYRVAIMSENAMVEFYIVGTPINRWRLDPVVEAIRIP